MFEKITVFYKSKPLNLVRIKEKTDGKNNSSYDGTWVVEEKFNRFRATNEKKTNLDSYQADEIFFLKKFPNKKAIVEGFAEAVLGEIIDQCIVEKIIPEDYKDCFSPAQAIVLPGNAGLALLQPFAQGYNPIFTIPKPDQKKRHTTLEVFLKKLLNIRYEFAIENCKPSGLSYIFMFSLIFANYSFHSANVFYKDIKILSEKISSGNIQNESFKELLERLEAISDNGELVQKALSKESLLCDKYPTKDLKKIFDEILFQKELLNNIVSENNLYTIERVYKLIDYGAAFRNFGKTYEAKNIFVSLDELTWFFNAHKHYTNFYRNISNFFESVARHAKDFYEDIEANSELKQKFKGIIIKAVINAYNTLKQSSGVNWQKIRSTLFGYILNADPSEYSLIEGHGKNEKEHDNYLRERFAAKIANIALYRLYELSVWTPPEERVASTKSSVTTPRGNPTAAYYDSTPELAKTFQKDGEDNDGASSVSSQTSLDFVSGEGDQDHKKSPNNPTSCGENSSTGYSFYTNFTSPNQSRQDPNLVNQINSTVRFLDDKEDRRIPDVSKRPIAWVEKRSISIKKNHEKIDASGIPEWINSWETLTAYKNEIVPRVINNLGKLSDNTLNLQRLISGLQDVLKIAKGEPIEDKSLQAIIKSFRRKRNIFGGEGATRSYRRVVTAYKAAILNIVQSLNKEERQHYFSSDLFDQCDQNHIDLLRELLNTHTGFFAIGTTTSAKKFDRLMPPCAHQSPIACFFRLSSSRNYQQLSSNNRPIPERIH